MDEDHVRYGEEEEEKVAGDLSSPALTALAGDTALGEEVPSGHLQTARRVSSSIVILEQTFAAGTWSPASPEFAQLIPLPVLPSPQDFHSCLLGESPQLRGGLAEPTIGGDSPLLVDVEVASRFLTVMATSSHEAPPTAPRPTEERTVVSHVVVPNGPRPVSRTVPRCGALRSGVAQEATLMASRRCFSLPTLEEEGNTDFSSLATSISHDRLPFVPVHQHVSMESLDAAMTAGATSTTCMSGGNSGVSATIAVPKVPEIRIPQRQMNTFADPEGSLSGTSFPMALGYGPRGTPHNRSFQSARSSRSARHSHRYSTMNSSMPNLKELFPTLPPEMYFTRERFTVSDEASKKLGCGAYGTVRQAELYPPGLEGGAYSTPFMESFSSCPNTPRCAPAAAAKLTGSFSLCTAPAGGGVETGALYRHSRVPSIMSVESVPMLPLHQLPYNELTASFYNGLDEVSVLEPEEEVVSEELLNSQNVTEPDGVLQVFSSSVSSVVLGSLTSPPIEESGLPYQSDHKSGNFRGRGSFSMTYPLPVPPPPVHHHHHASDEDQRYQESGESVPPCLFAETSTGGLPVDKSIGSISRDEDESSSHTNTQTFVFPSSASPVRYPPRASTASCDAATEDEKEDTVLGVEVSATHLSEQNLSMDSAVCGREYYGGNGPHAGDSTTINKANDNLNTTSASFLRCAPSLGVNSTYSPPAPATAASSVPVISQEEVTTTPLRLPTILYPGSINDCAVAQVLLENVRGLSTDSYDPVDLLRSISPCDGSAREVDPHLMSGTEIEVAILGDLACISSFDAETSAVDTTSMDDFEQHCNSSSTDLSRAPKDSVPNVDTQMMQGIEHLPIVVEEGVSGVREFRSGVVAGEATPPHRADSTTNSPLHSVSTMEGDPVRVGVSKEISESISHPSMLEKNGNVDWTVRRGPQQPHRVVGCDAGAVPGCVSPTSTASSLFSIGLTASALGNSSGAQPRGTPQLASTEPVLPTIRYGVNSTMISDAFAHGCAPFRPVAVKVVDKATLMRSTLRLNAFHNELRMASRLQHPCLVNVFGVAEDVENFYFVMDLAEKGNVTQYLKKFGVADTREMAPRFLADVVLALEYLRDGSQHEYLPPQQGSETATQTAMRSPPCTNTGIRYKSADAQPSLDSTIALSTSCAAVPEVMEGDFLPQEESVVLHRDVKPDNLLLTWDYHVKLADFGDACFYGDVEANTFGGSPGYLSPEVVVKSKADPNSDLWSLGCVLYELLTGRRLFEGKSDVAVMQKVKYFQPSDLVFSEEVIEKTTEAARDLVAQLLQPIPEERLGAQQRGGFAALKAHTFFAGINWDTVLETTNMTTTNTDYTAELADYLEPSEVVVYCSPVVQVSNLDGRQQLSSRVSAPLVMALTDTPRLFLINPDMDGEQLIIPWSKELRVSVQHTEQFSITVPQSERAAHLTDPLTSSATSPPMASTITYTFTDMNRRADLWGVKIYHQQTAPLAGGGPELTSSSVAPAPASTTLLPSTGLRRGSVRVSPRAGCMIRRLRMTPRSARAGGSSNSSVMDLHPNTPREMVVGTGSGSGGRSKQISRSMSEVGLWPSPPATHYTTGVGSSYFGCETAPTTPVPAGHHGPPDPHGAGGLSSNRRPTKMTVTIASSSERYGSMASLRSLNGLPYDGTTHRIDLPSSGHVLVEPTTPGMLTSLPPTTAVGANRQRSHRSASSTGSFHRL